jgi:hypothetical protein
LVYLFKGGTKKEKIQALHGSNKESEVHQLLKPEEFKAKTTEILQSLTDQAKVSTLLSELVTDNAEYVAEVTKVTETVTKLNNDNEGLRQANMKLFLQVGETKPVEQQNKATDNTPKFDDLFNDKGELK